MIVTDEQKRIELMHTIDRFVAIIKPKQPFLDWLESLPDWDLDMTLEKLRGDSNAYLVPEYDSTEQAMRYIERNHKAIFEWELWSWYTDETSWPEKLTPSVFRKWFDVEIYEMVIDLLGKHIMREEL
jgi:hypothetical protein